MICQVGLQWLETVEQRTDLKVDYERAKETYQRVQLRKLEAHDEKLIKNDIVRTYQEEPYFISSEG